MKPSILFSVAGVLSFLTGGLSAYAQTTPAAPPTEGKPINYDQVTTQTINQLLQAGVVEQNQNGELVIQKSILQNLQDQGRLDQTDSRPTTICD
jgi:hypothetical protein